MNTCGQCAHYVQFVNEANGYCHHSPPTVYKDGTTSLPPVVKANRHACGQIKLLVPGEAVEIRTKANVPSHGLVAKKDAPKISTIKNKAGIPTTKVTMPPDHVAQKDRTPMAERIPVQQPEA